MTEMSPSNGVDSPTRRRAYTALNIALLAIGLTLTGFAPAGAAAAQPKPALAATAQGSGPNSAAISNGMLGMPFSPTVDRMEDRLATMKAAINPNDEQISLWIAFADALRASTRSHNAMLDQMTSQPVGTLPDRLRLMDNVLNSALDKLRRTESALKPLYAALKPAQRQQLERLLPGPLPADLLNKTALENAKPAAATGDGSAAPATH